jgi:hypothetical protein
LLPDLIDQVFGKNGGFGMNAVRLKLLKNPVVPIVLRCRRRTLGTIAASEDRDLVHGIQNSPHLRIFSWRDMSDCQNLPSARSGFTAA